MQFSSGLEHSIVLLQFIVNILYFGFYVFPALSASEEIQLGHEQYSDREIPKIPTT